MSKRVSDETKLQVQMLWGEGLNGVQIAERLGLPSRSAVMGILHRLRGAGVETKKGVPLQPVVTEKPLPVQPIDLPNPFKAPPKKIREPIAIPVARNIKFMDLTATTCRWPTGDVYSKDGVTFCGALTSPEQVYCAEHHKRAHVSPLVSARARQAWSDDRKERAKSALLARLHIHF